VSEQILNHTSALLGYTQCHSHRYTLENTGAEDKLKSDTTKTKHKR